MAIFAIKFEKQKNDLKLCKKQNAYKINKNY